VTAFGASIGPGLPIADTSRALEDLGYDYIATGEHVAFHGPVPNAFVTLGVAAGATSRIGLVSAVTLLPLYPAVLAAKLTAELAHHSQGRFELGVGIGGEFPAEFAACGVPVAERAARAEEAIVVIRRLLAADDVSFDGRFTSFEGLTLAPRPSAVPPVWIGGRKRGAMQRAARYGDVWMPYLYTPEQYRASRDTIAREAEEQARDPAAIASALFIWACVEQDGRRAAAHATARLSAIYGMDMRAAVERYVVAGTPSECAARLADYQAAGVERMIFATLAGDAAGHLEMLGDIAAEVIPQLRGGGPGAGP
jgi:alkanesulfonate monooxygenase SsuD/methylene tetrahydromethanopterin reductase-like flavin-dependent oxidoreductase (luciferase family)